LSAAMPIPVSDTEKDSSTPSSVALRHRTSNSIRPRQPPRSFSTCSSSPPGARRRAGPRACRAGERLETRAGRLFALRRQGV
jgi:hypothetical protein